MFNLLQLVQSKQAFQTNNCQTVNKYFFLILGGTRSLVGVLNLDRADIGESPQDEQQQQRPLSITPAPHISAYLHILSVPHLPTYCTFSHHQQGRIATRKCFLFGSMLEVNIVSKYFLELFLRSFICLQKLKTISNCYFKAAYLAGNEQ